MGWGDSKESLSHLIETTGVRSQKRKGDLRDIIINLYMRYKNLFGEGTFVPGEGR